MNKRLEQPPLTPNPLNRLRIEGNMEDNAKTVLFLDDIQIPLSPQQTRLFNALLTARGSIVHRSELARLTFPSNPEKWDKPKSIVDPIQDLKIAVEGATGRDGLQIRIENQRGSGYKLAYRFEPPRA